MMIAKSLTRTLLAAGLLFGAFWISLPPQGEAITTSTGDGEEWLLTGAAQQRTAAGECSNMGTFDTCRERCLWGSPTGEFGCFPQ